MIKLFAMFGKRFAKKSSARRRPAMAASRLALARNMRLEPLEDRHLLSINIPILNGNFESPTWVRKW